MKFRKILMLFVLMGCMIFPTNVIAANTDTEIKIENVARTDYITWQYKTINGVLYKRLYNFTTNTALSGWQIVT